MNAWQLAKELDPSGRHTPFIIISAQFSELARPLLRVLHLRSPRQLRCQRQARALQTCTSCRRTTRHARTHRTARTSGHEGLPTARCTRVHRVRVALSTAPMQAGRQGQQAAHTLDAPGGRGSGPAAQSVGKQCCRICAAT